MKGVINMENTINDLIERSEKIFQEIYNLKKTFNIMDTQGEDDPIYQKWLTLDIASDHIFDGYTYLKSFKEQIEG
jgi:hypothetical protein